MRIAFIGIGNMGAPMATRLLAAGHALTVHSRTRSRGEALVAQGAGFATSPGAAVREAEAVITMVGGPADVAALYYEGILDALPHGALAIDMTTSSPALAHELAAAAATRGIAMLDAPVTGGVGGATAGTLSILVGGDAAAIERARALFAALGTVTHCGPAGSGQRLKLVNQTVVAGIVQGLAEGVALAREGGIDCATMVDALGKGTAGGMLFNAYARKMFEGDFAATFSVAHFLKDLRLALDEATSLGLDPRGLAVTLGQFERLAATKGDTVGIQGLAALYRRSVQ